MGAWICIDAYRPLSWMLYPRPPPMDTVERLTRLGPDARAHVSVPKITGTGGMVLLRSHGNASSVEMEKEDVDEMAFRFAMPVVAWEYPGYGADTRGTPSSASICAAAEQAYDWTARAWPGATIVVMGRSIGTGPACHLARVRPIGALVLQSPFTTIADLAAEHVGWGTGYVCPAIYDNLAAVSEMRAPVLFIHGMRDTLIPRQHSQRLFSAAQKSRMRRAHYAPMADHNAWRQEEDVWMPMDGFLRDMLRLPL